MNDLPQPRELVEKIFLENRVGVWIALSIGSCGILTRALVGRHEREYMESQRIALAFAHHVVQAVGFSPAHNRVSTPQILVDAADAVIDDPDHVFLLSTTWQCRPEGVEICSVGSNSVLVFEGDTIRAVITPHTVIELLQRQGKVPDAKYGNHVTHALGSRKSEKSCHINDVRVAHVPFLPTATIAIIQHRRLADAIIRLAVPRNRLPAFIEEWTPPGKRIRTSVLLSL